MASAGWTVAIAAVTYLTLCHPVSRLSELLEHRYAPYFIPTAVYLTGLIPAAFGTGFFDQQDLGGVCWYKSGSMQNTLMLFVPRTLALVTVIVLCEFGGTLSSLENQIADHFVLASSQTCASGSTLPRATSPS